MHSGSATAITRLAYGSPARKLMSAPVLAPARPAGRAAHFIDVENLCGSSDVRTYEAQTVMRRYHDAVQIADGDHVIVAASHHNAFAAGWSWPGARLLMPCSGPDGADRMIRDALRQENIAARFAVVFLGSGDGGFAADLAGLAAEGARTHVVSRASSLSRALRLAAHAVTTLPPRIGGRP
ncbi:MAG: hypothetical protein WAX14_17465 [Rhodococcus sp. (in: high G+C Gram-positive bacteria)]|uniref:hypothetical protein n=1 Tax=Rhodococcus sp. TaxID=1831 RepID=UPI003BB67376